MRQVTTAHAHCDLYCGVYDPAQAKIEALSVLKIAQKYHESDDDVFKARAIHQAGDAKKSMDPAEGQKLIDLIDEVAEIFWKTEKAKSMGVYPV